MPHWPNRVLNGYSVSSTFELPTYDCTQLETLVVISVEGCTGAPTSARLTARFEMAQLTSGGSMTKTGGFWTPVDADLHPTFLPDGDWPTVIADQTTTSLTLSKIDTVSASTALLQKSGGTATAPFAIGQRLSGNTIHAPGSTNRIIAIGSAGDAGTVGSSATLEFPAASTSSGNGVGTLYTNPVTVARRIRTLPHWRLVLLPTFTGGTSPAFTVTVSTDTEA